MESWWCVHALTSANTSCSHDKRWLHCISHFQQEWSGINAANCLLSYTGAYHWFNFTSDLNQPFGVFSRCHSAFLLTLHFSKMGGFAESPCFWTLEACCELSFCYCLFPYHLMWCSPMSGGGVKGHLLSHMREEREKESERKIRKTPPWMRGSWV